MHVDDIISALNKQVIRVSNVDYYSTVKVKQYLEDLSKECIRWSTDDFKNIAIQKKGEDWQDWYDEDLFESALHSMIARHNAMAGINWETVDYYLELYCRKKYDPIK